MWPAHRLVLAEKLTWTEVDTLMSVQEVLEFGEAYDVWFDATNEPTETP